MNKSNDYTFPNEFTQALEGVGALALVYNLIAHSLNSVLAIFIGRESSDAIPALFSFGSPPGFFWDVVIVCLASGAAAYIALKYICRRQWVQETVNFKECRKEKKWYNPWHWGQVLVCTVKEAIKWVLKSICEWKEVLVTIAVLICLAAAIIVVL